MKPGQKAPSFTLKDENEQTVKLADFKGKWVVLYFYPKDNTPGCTIEAIDFTKFLSKFKAANAVVLGCSPDSAKSHCKFIEKKDLKVTLLSDPEHKVIGKYGSWGLKKFMGVEFMGVIRSTFLINPEGKIVHVWSPVKVKNHAEEVLALLKEKT